MIEEKTRLDYVDIAKGIGIVSVIFGHMRYSHWWASSFQFLVHPFHMPLFFIVAGLFLSTSGSFWDFAKNKARRLLVPYLFFGSIGVCAMGLCVLGSAGSEAFLSQMKSSMLSFIYALSDSIDNTLIGSVAGIGAIWFLPALLISLLTARLLVKIRYGLFVAFGLSALTLAYKELGGKWLPLNLENGVFCASYVLIGKMLMTRTNLLKSSSGSLAGLGVAVYVSCVLCRSWLSLSRLNFSNYFMPFFSVLIVYSVLVFSAYIADRKFVGVQVLKMIGRQSLLVLCFHYLFCSRGWGWLVRAALRYFPSGIMRSAVFFVAEWTVPFIPVLWIFLKEKGWQSKHA